jgi:hypothetical protein
VNYFVETTVHNRVDLEGIFTAFGSCPSAFGALYSDILLVVSPPTDLFQNHIHSNWPKYLVTECKESS